MTKNNISIRNLSPQRAVIDIEGTIGVDENMQFSNPGQRVATYEKLSDTLVRISEIEAPEVVVNIRSTGGDVNDALLIYEALKSLPGRVITCCYGYTASAATVIAQAASTGCRRIASGALYLIHNSSCATEGNAAELAASTDLLRKTDERLAALYAERSGASVEGFVALMAENNGAGRWLSPAEAVKAGLADAVIDDAHREEAPQGLKTIAADGSGAINIAAIPADDPETEAATEGCTADGLSRSEKETYTADDLSQSAKGTCSANSLSRSAKGICSADGLSRSDKEVCTADNLSQSAKGTCSADGLSRSVDTAEALSGKSVEKSAEKSAGTSAATAKEHVRPSAETAVAASAQKSAQKTEEKPVNGWRTLLRQLRNLFGGGGKTQTEEHSTAFRTAAPPVDKNILHTDDPDPLHEMIRSRIAFRRGQNAVKPTVTEPVEDPAACDVHRSANQRAYDEDARRMRM